MILVCNALQFHIEADKFGVAKCGFFALLVLARSPPRESSNGRSIVRSRPRVNGAGTTTFRRPSVATSLSQSSLYQTHQNQGANHVPSPGAYVPPHHQNNSARNGTIADSRFSKDQLLSIYKAQKESGELGKNIVDLFIGGWQPGNVIAGSGSLWSQKDELGKDSAIGPDICWDINGDLSPLGLREMSDEEKEVTQLPYMHSA